MELSKKTTILLTQDLHRQLVQIAGARHVSLGELVRQACERQYGLTDLAQRLDAVRELESMRLPVGDCKEMKQQSVPSVEEPVT